MNLTFKIHTYGCKVNTYDSGLLQARMQKSGFEPSNEPRVHILNTCAVTKEATREAVKSARKLKSKDPFALVVVTGCAAQVDTDEFSHLPGVDLVVANSHKGQLEDLIRRYYVGSLRERVHKSNIFKKEDLEPGGGMEAEHTRAFLKIQDGCNSFCTFCVIPFARGKSRSLSISDITSRINGLCEQGVREVVLTGVHIADYRDGNQGLEDLVEAVLTKTLISRIRLTSLEPGEVSERLFDLFQDERLCRHFHMSIQSANSKVLKDMKRSYDADAVEESLNDIAARVPGAYVGMDVIAGFPGETEEEFADTYMRLDRLPWTRMHVFPYSSRPGTFAARRDDVLERGLVKARALALRQLSENRFKIEAARQVGLEKTALTLRNGKLLSSDYWSITTDQVTSGENQFVRLRVTSVDASGGLRGQVLDAMSL